MQAAKTRAVFLDRDGVINEASLRNGKPYPPADLDELVLTAGAEKALADLKARGFLLLVVTNQPDVRRGVTTIENVERIHDALQAQLPIDDFFVCLHDDRDGCDCRKPLPGLIRRAGEKYGVDLAASYMIGDRWRDVDAAAAAGCRTIFIDRGYNEQGSKLPPEKVAFSLPEAVAWIVAEEE